jgi:MFS family permease
MHASPSVGRSHLAFAALLLAMLVAQLDTNIVVAALPRIADQLTAGSAIAGVTGAYLLAVTVTTPLHGRLGDMLGRRAMFVASIAVFVVGSLGCAAAGSMSVLVTARAVQGIGGGGLIVVAVSALGQMYDRAELVRRQIWLTGVFAVSSIAGPPVGGFLAGGLGWQSIFLVNLPICAVALTIGVGGLPGRPPRTSGRGFDYWGAALVAAGGIAVVLLGTSRSLATSPVWAPALIAVFVCAGVGFVSAERRAAAPLIPPTLFTGRLLRQSIVLTLLSGVALFGTFTYVPLVILADPAANAAETGLLLLPMTIGQLVITTSFAVLARRFPQLTGWGQLGISAGVVGLCILAVLPGLEGGGPRTTLAAIGLAACGAGLGLSMQAYTLLAQTAAPKEAIGAAIGTLSFARQLGGSLGVAVFGWLTLIISGGHGLSTVFLLAAAVLLIGLTAAPRARDESAAQPATVPH